MTSRFRPRRWIFCLPLLASTVGCDVATWTGATGPIVYRDSSQMAVALAEKPNLAGKVRTILADNFGPDVQHIKVPAGSGLRDGGVYLSHLIRVGDKVQPATMADPETGKVGKIEGGYLLYRRHCLHCHGVEGGGDGPTAAYLFPRPRDYRPGIFKFTSTKPVNAKPTREDLRKTLLYGLHGTSMPGFEAIMTLGEIDQVIDYMTFLSVRGEVEKFLVTEASSGDDKDAAGALEPDLVEEVIQTIGTSWSDASTGVVNPSTHRVASTDDSIKRGRDLYLGINTAGPKLECVGCHGQGAQGNGTAFIDRKVFDDVVFRQYSLDEAIARLWRLQQEEAQHESPSKAVAESDPKGVETFLKDNPAILGVLRKDHGLLAEANLSDADFRKKVDAEMPEVASAARKILPDLDDPKFRAFLVNKYDLWTKGSLDDWHNPLRAANLINGVYKGGRRPIDLYWRLAKGINGAKMPAHASILTDDQMWDIVNFVLALPEKPELLDVPRAVAAQAPSAEGHR